MKKEPNEKIIKAVVAIIMAVVVIGVIFVAQLFTNKSLIDLTYSFESAYITLPNGEVICGRVSSWTDFEDGDQIQLTIDGKTYLTHFSNVVMISE